MVSAAATHADSVTWNLGDGTNGTGDTINHIYNHDRTCQVCVQVYTACGPGDTCFTVTIATDSSTSISGYNTDPVLFKIYPNPTNGELTFERSAEAENHQIRVYNIMGVLVSKFIIRKGKTTLDIKDLPAGTYLFRITKPGERQKVVTIIKTKE